MLRPLVDERFQGLLHSPVRGSFHLSLTVLVHYRLLRWSFEQLMLYAYGPVTLCRTPFQKLPLLMDCSRYDSYNPGIAVTTPVWAISLSLATTREIDISFFSSR